MFLLILIIMLVFNVTWYLISDYWLRQVLKNYRIARKYTRIALLLWMFIIFIPIISAAFGLGNPLESSPWLWTSVIYLWMGAIVLWMLGMAIVFIPIWRYSKFKSLSNIEEEKLNNVENTNLASDGLSRRQFVKIGLVATPPLLVSGIALTTVFSKRNLNVRKIDLPVTNLPPDLEGYTITQISDTHIGILTGREQMEYIVSTANQLKSNMTVITGDILDNNYDFMPDLVDTISELQAEQGVFLCIGNHDKIDSGNKWVQDIRKAGFNLLFDESTIVDTGATPIKLLGIDFARNLKEDYVNIKRADEHTQTPDKNLKILLAHHPHAFDAAAEMNIPLTLAGHTHGGQLALRIGESFELFNAGNYLFRYVDGIYKKDEGNSLFVHRGSGDWFPLRTGVPTEVVQLRLVSG